MTASKSANYTLTNTSLSSTDGMSLALSGITIANLTATGSGHTFTVTGWTGTGSLTGTAATVTDAAGGGFTLTNTQLIAPNTTLTLSGITTANLTDVGSGNTFTVSGWTGTGSLTGTLDTVTATKNANYTLTNTSLSSTDGMSLGLSGITTANLTATGSGHSFTISGWSGSGLLTGMTATVTDTANAGFALTNSLLTSGTMSLVLSGITTANLTDTGSGHTFTVSGWTHGGTLTGTADTVAASKGANYTLTNTLLSSTDGMSLGLERDHDRQPDRHGQRSQLHRQRLDRERVADRHDGDRDGDQERQLHLDQHFAVVHRWHVAGLDRHHHRQPDGHGQRPLLHCHRLDRDRVADRHGGDRDGAAGRRLHPHQHPVDRPEHDADFERHHDRQPHRHGQRQYVHRHRLDRDRVAHRHVGHRDGDQKRQHHTDQLRVDGRHAWSLTLSSGITTANLTVTATVGHPNYVIDASAFSHGPTVLTASGTVYAILYGGTAGNDTLTATGSGNNILIGNGAGDTLTDNSIGRGILIGGGAGGDTLTGNGNDILVSGTTKYNSNTSANIAALDAILAEWTSADTYATKISKITQRRGPGQRRRAQRQHHHAGFKRQHPLGWQLIQPKTTGSFRGPATR